jgi:general secretion pathway protein K
MSTPKVHRPQPASQQGAALLTALLIVTLVATLAAGALWRQWQQVETESAERTRQQAAWLLIGAQDWARLILREDARTNQVDHLAEPWAVPLKEARLTTFLAADRQTSDDIFDAMLSGDITDLQGRLNVQGLITEESGTGKNSLAWRRLFTLLQLPLPELNTLMQRLRKRPTGDNGTSGSASAYPAPTRVEDLGLLGLSPATLARLAPYVTVLPQTTLVNLNTAPPEVLFASLGGIDLSLAQRMAQQRAITHFNNLADVRRLFPAANAALDDTVHGVSSRYFEIRGRLRLGDLIVEEHAIVERVNPEVRTLTRWRSAPLR